MTPDLRLVKSARELAADEARSRLVDYISSLSLTAGQHARVRDLVTDYGLRQYEAGYDRREHRNPRDAA